MHYVLGAVQILQRAKQLLQNKRDDLLSKLIRVVIAEEFLKLAISRQLHHNEQFVITLHKLQNPHDVLIVCYLEHLELLSHQADHVLTYGLDVLLLDHFYSAFKLGFLMYCNVDFAKFTLAYLVVELVLLFKISAATNVSELFNLVRINQHLRMLFQLLGRHLGNVVHVERSLVQVQRWTIRPIILACRPP